MIDRESLLAAAKLVDDLDGQRHREKQAFTEGFTVGYQDGYDVGYVRAHEEMAEQWRKLAQHIRRAANQPTHHEVQARRDELPDTPCGRPGCRSCSRCIRAEAVHRRGGDYRGERIPREVA